MDGARLFLALVIALIPAATYAQDRSASVAPAGQSDPLPRPNGTPSSVASLASARILPVARFQWSGLATGSDTARAPAGMIVSGRFVSKLVKDSPSGKAETIYYDLQ